ncbi:nucleoside phosphorylase domain-containing protein [Fusarium redolens]|uniref:Nucleoside phosphorylase domain-containing protein n=1 Tax=Fusarium redolens TaxID=48865 RepID=A0A9P9KJV5_FUSRE|nr:nucleoside phosphorylase domain-containing protein [Fusarium redolens]KAH7255299.1 nucleoside phosphorylase domain-containing protein [Fusarium redolens]
MIAPPKSRNDFLIGIICALPLEYEAIGHVVDEFWDIRLGRAVGDTNSYSVGRIGDDNVVLVMSGMGKANAASTAASLHISYPNLELVLVTGICGGVPTSDSGEELLLGDVVISKAVVEYDLFPGKLRTEGTVDDRLARPTRHIRSFVARFETDRLRDALEVKSAVILEELQSRAGVEGQASIYQYPGADKDCLFIPPYRHKHQSDCDICMSDSEEVCDASRKVSCSELGCDEEQLLDRKRLDQNWKLQKAGREKEAQAPFVFVGHFGSGDTVLKSGEERDRLARAHDIVAFEMEGAGVWDEIPCIIVKGVCDYADSHKHKGWQNFAAATAAAVMKALIEEYPKTDKPRKQIDESSRVENDGSSEVGRDAPVFYAGVSNCNIFTGFHSSGGTQVINFG